MHARSAAGDKAVQPAPKNIDEVIIALDRVLKARRRVVAAREALDKAEQSLAQAYDHYDIVSAASDP